MKAVKILFTALKLLIAVVFLFSAAMLLSGTRAYAVSTNSMEPELSTGDVIFVRTQASYAQGDIVTAKLHGSENTFTHRIYRLDSAENIIYTKGDANSEPDPMPTPISDIVGRVVFSLPLLGFVSLKITSTQAIIIMAAAMIVVAILETIITQKSRKGEVKDT